MRKKLEMDLEYLPYLSSMPVSPEQIHAKALQNDVSTIDHWKDIWVNNTKENHKNYGPFVDSHLGSEWGKYRGQPAIVLGSGPSLKNSIGPLSKRNKDKRIPVISCLHNFHYLIDNEVDVDLWVTLDAGEVTIEEISEGGTHQPEYYIEKTKGKTLAAFIGSHPKLIEAWQGDIKWFSCGIPVAEIRKSMHDIEPFEIYVSNGGNVLGACMYIAKGFWGCNPIAYGGADFCFDYIKKFHPWDSKYDGKLGKALLTNDIFGNKVFTWQSYANYKAWFEGISTKCPGIWINASEGGALGAYPEGLIPSMIQMTMDDFITMYRLPDELAYMMENPSKATEPGFTAPKVLF